MEEDESISFSAIPQGDRQYYEPRLKVRLRSELLLKHTELRHCILVRRDRTHPFSGIVFTPLPYAYLWAAVAGERFPEEATAAVVYHSLCSQTEAGNISECDIKLNQRYIYSGLCPGDQIKFWRSATRDPFALQTMVGYRINRLFIRYT